MLPSPEEVRRICAIPDDVVRNLRITECYSRLSQAVAQRKGACANWCTFATWASRQAGSTIRGEDLVARLENYSGSGWTPFEPVKSLWRALLRKGIFNPKTGLGRVVRAIHSPFDAFERASRAVADGNRKVFEEIGFEFARYLCEPFPEFAAGLRPGPPPEGQELLKRAFTHYELQAIETEPGRKAQLTFLANLEIGLHEQTRLQPQIRAALEVLPDTAEHLSLLIRWGARPYRRFARSVTRLVITDSLMVLRLPDAVLALGRNLDASFPPALAQFTEPELADLCARYEPASGCNDCGASDWADLTQRMHYILHLFRAYHADAGLMEPPFTEGQLSQLRDGKIPDGEL